MPQTKKRMEQRACIPVDDELRAKLHEAAKAFGAPFGTWARWVLIEQAKAMGIDIDAKTPGVSVRRRGRPPKA